MAFQWNSFEDINMLSLFEGSQTAIFECVNVGIWEKQTKICLSTKTKKKEENRTFCVIQ